MGWIYSCFCVRLSVMILLCRNGMLRLLLMIIDGVKVWLWVCKLGVMLKFVVCLFFVFGFRLNSVV